MQGSTILQWAHLLLLLAVTIFMFTVYLFGSHSLKLNPISVPEPNPEIKKVTEFDQEMVLKRDFGFKNVTENDPNIVHVPSREMEKPSEFDQESFPESDFEMNKVAEFDESDLDNKNIAEFYESDFEMKRVAEFYKPDLDIMKIAEFDEPVVNTTLVTEVISYTGSYISPFSINFLCCLEQFRMNYWDSFLRFLGMFMNK